MSPPGRILLVRTSSLGDVVHSLPVLAALRRAWPAARLAWVVEETYLPMLEGHPDIDRLIPVALRRWRLAPFDPSTWREVGLLLDALADFGADLALDLMGSHKGALLAALSFAPRRVGLAPGDRREPASALWINETVTAHGPHAVDRQLGVLAALGIDVDSVDFAPGKLFRRHGEPLPAGLAAERFALIHPGAAWGNKRLPPETWSEVAVGLRAAGLRVLVGAAPGEEALAGAVAAGGVAELVPAATLPRLAALARAAAVFLAGDTGPLHLAHALGTPVVCVMGPTDPTRHGPFRSPASVVVNRLPCSHCHRRMDSPRACLTTVDAGDVTRAALRMLTWSGSD